MFDALGIAESSLPNRAQGLSVMKYLRIGVPKLSPSVYPFSVSID